MPINEEIEAVIKDKTSGSSLLANRIEEIFPLIPQAELAKTVQRILKAHGAMAAVINRLNRLCLEREGQRVPASEDISESTFGQFWQENRERQEWLSLSMSGAVIRCFKSSPRRLHIKLGISYPDKEGRITHEQLKDDHQVVIYEDRKLASEVENSDALLLGADLVTDQFVVNKSGSLALASAAQYFAKPLYIITTGDKSLSPELSRFHRLIHTFEPVPRRLISKIYFTSRCPPLPTSRTFKALLGQQPGPDIP
jgi:hypothetical protein